LFLFSDGLANAGKKSHAEIFDLVRRIHNDGVSVSSYGIGSDFDETLMRGIQEYGTGDYFFISDDESIEKIIARGFNKMSQLLGTGAILRIRGKNGGIVRKVYAHPDLIKGASIGDLRENNIRRVIAKLEVAPSSDKAGDDLLTWELVYIPIGDDKLATMSGELHLNFTDDDEAVKTRNPAVEVAVTIQEVSDMDLDVLALVDSNKMKEAVAQHEKSLLLLQAVLPVDATGLVKSLLTKKIKVLNDLKTKDRGHARKQVHHEWAMECDMDARYCEDECD